MRLFLTQNQKKISHNQFISNPNFHSLTSHNPKYPISDYKKSCSSRDFNSLQLSPQVSWQIMAPTMQTKVPTELEQTTTVNIRPKSQVGGGIILSIFGHLIEAAKAASLPPYH